MNIDELVIVLVVLLAALVAAVGAAYGRSLKSEAQQDLTAENNYFQINYDASDEAFRRAFRMSRPCFKQLTSYLRRRWSAYYGYAAETNATKYSLEMT